MTFDAHFHSDYGFNIELGEDFYANVNLVILDGAKVVIPPFLRGLGRRIYAAILSFWAGVIPRNVARCLVPADIEPQGRLPVILP